MLWAGLVCLVGGGVGWEELDIILCWRWELGGACLSVCDKLQFVEAGEGGGSGGAVKVCMPGMGSWLALSTSHHG